MRHLEIGDSPQVRGSHPSGLPPCGGLYNFLRLTVNYSLVDEPSKSKHLTKNNLYIYTVY